MIVTINLVNICHPYVVAKKFFFLVMRTFEIDSLGNFFLFIIFLIGV